MEGREEGRENRGAGESERGQGRDRKNRRDGKEGLPSLASLPAQLELRFSTH